MRLEKMVRMGSRVRCRGERAERRSPSSAEGELLTVPAKQGGSVVKHKCKFAKDLCVNLYGVC